MTPLNADAQSPRPAGGNGQERLSRREEEKEEFPRGKPRERSSPSTERPDRTQGIPLAADQRTLEAQTHGNSRVLLRQVFGLHYERSRKPQGS